MPGTACAASSKCQRQVRWALQQVQPSRPPSPTQSTQVCKDKVATATWSQQQAGAPHLHQPVRHLRPGACGQLALAQPQLVVHKVAHTRHLTHLSNQLGLHRKTGVRPSQRGS